MPRPPCSAIGWQLLGEGQQNLLQIEATHTQVSVVRLLDSSNPMLDKAARDPGPLLHREIRGAEHFDLVSEVRDTGGEVLCGVFLGVRLAQVQRIVDDTLHPEHAIRVLD